MTANRSSAPTVLFVAAAEITPEMYDAVSIWCVAVNISFGDGVLTPLR